MDHRLTRLIAVASSSVLVLTILAAAPAAVRATTQIYIGDGTGSGDCAPGVLDFETDGSDDNLVFDVAANAAGGSLNNILYVCPGTYDITEDIDVSSDLTIVGVAGAAATVLDSDGTSRILDLDGDSIIRGLTFKDGNAGGGDGGAIYSDDYDLTVEDSVFVNNQGYNGGAIYAFDLDLVLGSTFTDNSADLDGGAIFVDVDIVDGNGDGESGLIGNTFSGNTADDDGGAVHAEEDLSASSVISRNTFSNNVADSDLSGDGDGGAVSIDDMDGSATGNEFTTNSAESGGAMRIDDLQNSLSNNKFISNSAVGQGGGLRIDDIVETSVVSRNQFRGNTAGGDGGGAWIDDSSDDGSELAVVRGNMFRGNRAEGSGGGLYLYWTDTAVAPKYVTRNSFRSNRAGDIGGGIAIMGLQECVSELTTRQAARAFKKNRYASNRASGSRRSMNVGAEPCEWGF